jgi:hypothetical protein
MAKKQITTNALLAILSETPTGMTTVNVFDTLGERVSSAKAGIRTALQASPFVTAIPSMEMRGNNPVTKFKLKEYLPASPEGKALAAAIREGFRELNG